MRTTTQQSPPESSPSHVKEIFSDNFPFQSRGFKETKETKETKERKTERKKSHRILLFSVVVVVVVT